MRPFIEELDQRGLSAKSNAPHQVGNMVPIEASGCREQDEVVASLDQVGRHDGLWFGTIALLLRNKFKIVVPYVENAGRGAILDRNRHPPFRRDQTDVADWSF